MLPFRRYLAVLGQLIGPEKETGKRIESVILMFNAQHPRIAVMQQGSDIFAPVDAPVPRDDIAPPAFSIHTAAGAFGVID